MHETNTQIRHLYTEKKESSDLKYTGGMPAYKENPADLLQLLP